MDERDKKVRILSIAIGNTVNKYRKKKKLSINHFAYESDFAKATIGRIEKGSYQIGVSYLWQLAEAMGMDVSKFVREIKKELPDDFRFIDV